MSYNRHPYAQPSPPQPNSSQYMAQSNISSMGSGYGASAGNYNGNPAAGYNQGRQTTPQNEFRAGHRVISSVDLARQFDIDMRKIQMDLFYNRDVEEYISHVPIVEDSKSPSQRPPPNSAPSNKKERYLILAKKASGRMMLHKAKVSSSGVFQIGRSWDFDELKLIKVDELIQTGFTFYLGKLYFWEVHTPKERRVWCRTVLEHYIRYNNGRLPELQNCSVDYFHLEDLYSAYNGNDLNKSTIKNVSNTMNAKPSLSPNKNRDLNKQSHLISPSRESSRTGTPRSPTKSNSSEVSSLKKSLASPPVGASPLGSAPFGSLGTKVATAAALAGVAATNTTNDRSSDAKMKQKQIEEDELQKKQKEKEARRKLELEKRKQLELERRKQEELERRKAELEEEEKKQHELERIKLEEEERQKQMILAQQRQAEEEAQRKQLEKEKEAAALEQEKLAIQRQQQQLKQQQNEQRRKQEQLNFVAKPPAISQLAQRGPPSLALSEAPSQMSFEYGDEERYRNNNQSFESAISNDLDTYLDEYMGNGEEEHETAPLNLMVPKIRARSESSQDTEKGDAQQTPQPPKITTTLKELGLNADQEPFGEGSTEKNHDYVERELNMLLTPTNHLLSIEDTLDSTVSESGREHARSRAFSRVHDDNIDNNNILEILEEIGYDPVTDDSTTLELKLLKELDKLQYEKIQTVTQVTSVTSALKDSVSTAFQNCDRIDPILSLFGVELSTFKDDVDFIENQGQGLQVEATNEKLLMNELNEIVHSVEISDLKLQKLLSPKIMLGDQNSEIENILHELYTALKKINDANEGNTTNSNFEEYQISKMKALQEKKEIFEGAKNKFIRNFTTFAPKLFESVSLSLSSKLEHITDENFESKFMKTVFLDKSSYLLTLSGLIAFVKNVDEVAYNGLMNSFIISFKPFFENLITVMMQNLNQQVSSLNVAQFHLVNYPSQFIDEVYMELRGNSDFGAKKSDLFSKHAATDGSDSLKDKDISLMQLVKTYLSHLTNVISIEQELVRNLFSMSSSLEMQFQNLVRTPLSKRCEQFYNNDNYLSKTIESDREIADNIYEFMRNIFDQGFSATLKMLISISRSNILTTPAISCLLKTFSSSLAPTSQEYLYGNFSKVDAKIGSLWNKMLDQEAQNIGNTKLQCAITCYTKAYSVFYMRIQRIIDSLKLVNVTAFGADEKNYGNYYMLFGILKSTLTRGSENMKIEIAVSENNSESGDIDGNVSTQKHLVLLMNYKWLYEESRHLPEFPKDLSRSIDDLRDRELRLFSASFGRQYTIGNIMRLVEDLDDLLSNDGSPANFATYSVENIKSMMLPFKGDSFKQEISLLASDLKSMLQGRCYDTSGSDIENSFSRSIGERIEKELYNNCMYALCQLYITTFTKLSTIVDKYYTNFEVPVDKYIINFNFKKHYS